MPNRERTLIRAAKPLPFIQAPANPGAITDEAADAIAELLLDAIDEQDRQRGHLPGQPSDPFPLAATKIQTIA
jgi:hypothetical protein